MIRLAKCIPSHLGFPGVTIGKEPTCQCRRCKRHGFDPWVREDLLEKDTATHSSILAWRIPWTEDPGGLQSIWLQRVGHNWSDLAHTHSHCPIASCLGLRTCCFLVPSLGSATSVFPTTCVSPTTEERDSYITREDSCLILPKLHPL